MNKISKTQIPFSFLAYLFFFTFSQAIIAQNRPAIGIMASAQYSKLLTSGTSEFEQTYKESPSFALDVLAKAKLSDHVSLSFGLGWLRKKNQYNVSMLYFASPSPNAQPQAATRFTEVQYHRLRAPILFRYHLNSITKGCFFGLGLLPAIHFNEQVNTEIKSSSGETLLAYEDKFSGVSGRTLGFHFDLGTIISIKESLSLHTELFSDFSPNRNYNEAYMQFEGGLRIGIWF